MKNHLPRILKHFALALLAAGALALSGAAQTASRPNILLVISDDQSWPYAGAYRTRALRTPAFDRVAREGVLFTHAFAPSPGCSPSRAALLTGRNAWELAEAGTHASSFPQRLAVYPDLLEAAGYFVGMTGKGWGPGDWRAGGRTHNPAGRNFPTNRAEVNESGDKNKLVAGFKSFLAERPKEKPFCFWFGDHSPHRPFAARSNVDAAQLAAVTVPAFLPDTPEVRRDLLDYFAEIEAFDRRLGELLALLEAAGEPDRTLVIVTADNGMPFQRAKANAYDAGARVPLAIRWPGKAKGGRVVDDLVSLIDLTPTILEAAGLRAPTERRGKSLVKLLASNKTGIVEASRQAVFIHRERHSSAREGNLGYPVRAVRTRDYLYVRNFAPDRWPAGDPRPALGTKDQFGCYDIDASPTKTLMWTRRDDAAIGKLWRLAVEQRPAEELYDLRRDPAQLTNLAERAEHAATKQKLRARLDAYLKQTSDARVTGNGAVWESYPRLQGSIRKFEREQQ